MASQKHVEIVRHPISLKIFGIALILLALMIVVTLLSSINLRRVGQELGLLSNYYIQLDQLMGDTHAQTLREVILIERVLHNKPQIVGGGEAEAAIFFKQSNDCDGEAMRSVANNIRKTYAGRGEQQLMLYRVTRLCTDSRLARANELVDRALALPQVAGEPEETARFTKIKVQLADIPESRNKLHQEFENYLSRLGDGDGKALWALHDQIDERRFDINRRINTIGHELHAGTHRAAQLTTGMERRTQWLSWSVTLAACVLGLAVAYFVTRNLVRPVRELVNLTNAIRSGNLDIQIQIKTSDEIALLADSFNHMVGEMRQKEMIETIFGKYVDPRIVKGLLHDQQHFFQGGERQVMSVFFSDLVGFTAACEGLTPDGVVRLLNQYFSLMAVPIRAHNGIIDKYIGDSIMAFWGPPFSPAAEHAAQACFSALEQQACVAKFQAMLPDVLGIRKNVPVIKVRMGIATGDVTVGSIGSDDARSYTVIGDNVNLASRLESANKVYGTRILIGEDTRKLAGNSIEAREIDAIRVMGKTDPVHIYELIGKSGEISPQTIQLREHFERALSRYRSRRWDEAEAAFEACLKIDAEDGPSLLFLKRVKRFREQAPPEDWDGVWTMTEK